MSRQGLHQKPTFENIKAFWESEAQEIGSTPLVTIRDHYFRIHELHTLLPLIPAGCHLLDVGCGTGFGTLAFSRRSSYALGVDYSEKMIIWANRLKDDAEYRSEVSREFSPLWDLECANTSDSRLEFLQGDVTDLSFSRPPFNVITGQRILINLPSHEAQIGALAQLRSHTEEGGVLLLTEATLQGHQRTDEYRASFGLPILEKYWHNNYVDESRFEEWQEVGWKVQHDMGFATYALLSKVIYPAACGPENCEFLSGANASAMEMACVFRSRQSVEEIGQEAFLRLYVDRVAYYDKPVADEISRWIDENASKLPDWSRLGHQRLIVAHAH